MWAPCLSFFQLPEQEGQGWQSPEAWVLPPTFGRDPRQAPLDSTLSHLFINPCLEGRGNWQGLQPATASQHLKAPSVLDQRC